MTKDEALKLALETLECLKRDFDADQFEWGIADEAITAIKEHLEEKALQALNDENERLGLYKDAYAEQEPMAWISTGPASMIHWTSDKPAYGDDWVPLYTIPPQRKPQYDKTEMNCFVQDLYDKKIQEGKHGQYEAMFHVVHRAIEAAHGIKE